MKIYKEKELDDYFWEWTYRAQKMWIHICKENIEKYGNIGTCVLGAGIYINLIPKGKRKPRKYLIIESSEATNYQGSIIWEDGVEDVLKFLKKYDIEADYHPGRMD